MENVSTKNSFLVKLLPTTLNFHPIIYTTQAHRRVVAVTNTILDVWMKLKGHAKPNIPEKTGIEFLVTVCRKHGFFPIICEKKFLNDVFR